MKSLKANKNYEASIGLNDAANISTAASIFGARTERDARNRPGGFGRPVVGSNPDYYYRRAQKVLLEEIRSDDELSSLYLRGQLLNHSLEQSMLRNTIKLGGPPVGDAVRLVSVTEEIQARLAEKDLQVGLSGKWIERAQNISQFALRVIGSPEAALEQQLDQRSGGRVGGTLYRGLSPDTEVNTAVYWQSVLSQLRPEPGHHVTIIG